jgi:hypothetical protein
VVKFLQRAGDCLCVPRQAKRGVTVGKDVVRVAVVQPGTGVGVVVKHLQLFGEGFSTVVVDTVWFSVLATTDLSPTQKDLDNLLNTGDGEHLLLEDNTRVRVTQCFVIEGE